MNINDAPIDLADTKYIWSNVELIKQDIQEKMKDVELEEKHKDFKEKYPTLFKMVKSGANLQMLKEMTETIEQIKKGKKTYKTGMKNVAEKIGKKFLDKDKKMSDIVRND